MLDQEDPHPNKENLQFQNLIIAFIINFAWNKPIWNNRQTQVQNVSEKFYLIKARKDKFD